MSKKYTTNSFEETKAIGEDFAKEILQRGVQKNAVVLGLRGDLGAGKTTFLQGFARGLGVSEVVNSPTFIVMKRFKMYDLGFKNFYHIDCYRLEKPEEILKLDFKEIISNPENIVAIEWPGKIENVLPKDIISIELEHLKQDKRELVIGE